jgi:hypothetical protein
MRRLAEEALKIERYLAEAPAAVTDPEDEGIVAA